MGKEKKKKKTDRLIQEEPEYVTDHRKRYPGLSLPDQEPMKLEIKEEVDEDYDDEKVAASALTELEALLPKAFEEDNKKPLNNDSSDEEKNKRRRRRSSLEEHGNRRRNRDRHYERDKKDR